jgi:tetratricopeptide (TPR) repeat protein
MNILKVKLRILDSQLASMDPQDPAQTEKIAELQKQRAEVEMAEVESLSEANPTDMIILFDLATLYFKNGKLGKAIQALQKTQNYPGKKIPSLLLLGQCFAQRKMYDLAVRATAMRWRIKRAWMRRKRAPLPPGHHLRNDGQKRGSHRAIQAHLRGGYRLPGCGCACGCLLQRKRINSLPILNSKNENSKWTIS